MYPGWVVMCSLFVFCRWLSLSKPKGRGEPRGTTLLGRPSLVLGAPHSCSPRPVLVRTPRAPFFRQLRGDGPIVALRTRVSLHAPADKMEPVDFLLWALTVIGALAVVGSFVVLRKVPRDIRPVAFVPLGIVLVGFVVGALALAGVFG